jgi:phosphoglycolate phosphatase-like HAD superfamily hydrolase
MDELCVLCDAISNIAFKHLSRPAESAALQTKRLRYTLATMKVLALDFDGVVCDSLREVFATALATYETLEPGSPLIARLRARHDDGRWHSLDLIDDPVMVSFEAMMPLGNRAEDFGVSLRASDSFLELTDQGAYDAFYSTIDSEWMATFHRVFYQQRETARAFDSHGWTELHRSYPPFIELLRRRAGDASLALATAKDRRSAELLLQHLGVDDLFSPELVLDKETGVSKTAHLTAVRERLDLPFEDITFVDDKVNHLEAVSPLGVRPVLAGWGFNTPREHELAQRKGFPVANFHDAETVLYGGGTIG